MQNDTVIWYSATCLRSSHNQVYVQFETCSDADDPTSPLRREYVSAGDVRPAQPLELHRYLKIGEIVEGFCREKKGWRNAKVVEILENSRYAVSFEGEAQKGSHAEMEQWELRAVREWADGSWTPPFLLQEVLQVCVPDIFLIAVLIFELVLRFFVMHQCSLFVCLISVVVCHILVFLYWLLLSIFDLFNAEWVVF